MNRILTADVILTLTAGQALALHQALWVDVLVDDELYVVVEMLDTHLTKLGFEVSRHAPEVLA